MRWPTTTSASPWPAADKSTRPSRITEQALEINPDYVEAHNNLGIALADRGQIRRGHRPVPPGPGDQARLRARPTTTSARHLADRGQVDEAIAHYRKALEIKPDFAEAHNNLGAVLAGRGQSRRGYRPIPQGPGNQPRLGLRLTTNLGHALADGGQIEEAIAQYRKTLELKPGDADAHYNLGLVLARCGQFDEAIACFRKALTTNPDYAEAHFNLGLALAGRERIEEAIAEYRKALDLAKQQNNSALAESIRAKLRAP